MVILHRPQIYNQEQNNNEKMNNTVNLIIILIFKQFTKQNLSFQTNPLGDYDHAPFYFAFQKWLDKHIPSRVFNTVDPF